MFYVVVSFWFSHIKYIYGHGLFLFTSVDSCFPHADSCRGETYYDFSRTLPDQSQEPKLGDRVTIECDVQGAETVRWTADGTSVTELPQQYTTNGNSLTISSFSVEYDAFYQCVARDPASSVEQLSPPILVSAFGKYLYELSLNRILQFKLAFLWWYRNLYSSMIFFLNRE